MTEHSEHYKKIFFLLIFFCCNNIFGQVYPDKKVHELIIKGMDYTINQEYEKAEIIFNNLNQLYPKLPFGNICMTANFIIKAQDYGIPFNKNQIEKQLNDAEKKANELYEANDKDVWNIYFIAATQGYQTYYEALNDGWFNALTSGISAIKNYEKCLEIDPAFYESYVAIGFYKYWKSKKTEFLSWLPFISDEKELGIQYLKKAVKNTSYSLYLAASNLIWIYIGQKKIDEANALINHFIEKYPSNRFFKLASARCKEEMNRKEAVEIYFELLNSYIDKKILTRYNEVILKHKIAQNYFKMNENQKALNLCNEILAIKNFNDYEKKKLEKRLERVKELKSEILEKSK